MTNHLVLGLLRPDGTVDPTPHVVTLNDRGEVTAYCPLPAHEPASTTMLRAVLEPCSLKIVCLDNLSATEN